MEIKCCCIRYTIDLKLVEILALTRYQWHVKGWKEGLCLCPVVGRTVDSSEQGLSMLFAWHLTRRNDLILPDGVEVWSKPKSCCWTYISRLLWLPTCLLLLQQQEGRSFAAVSFLLPTHYSSVVLLVWRCKGRLSCHGEIFSLIGFGIQNCQVDPPRPTIRKWAKPPWLGL